MTEPIDTPTPDRPVELDPGMVEAAAKATHEHGEVEEVDGDLVCAECRAPIDGLDEARDGASHQARAALSAAGVPALIAEVESLRRWKAEALPVMAGLQDLGTALGVGLGERITGEAAVEKARALVAEVERAEGKYETLRAAIQRLADDAATDRSGYDGRVHCSALRAALTDDATVAGSGEQPGGCDGCGRPDDGNCNCPLTYDPAKAVPSRPAPVVPDSPDVGRGP